MFDSEKLVKEVNTRGKDWSQLEKARYIYIQLGKYYVYDHRFVSTEKLSERKRIANLDIKDIVDNKIVCVSAAKIYTNLLGQCGIDAKTVFIAPDEKDPKDVGHAYTKVIIDGKEGPAGLIKDLSNIKAGFKTEDFLKEIKEEQVEQEKERLRKLGLSEDRINEEIEKRRACILELSQDELRKIDEKIGYTQDGKYLDDIFDEIKEEFSKMMDDPKFSDLPKESIIAYQIDFITKRMQENKLPIIGKNDYFKKAIDICIGNKNIEEYFSKNTITCFSKDGKMEIFHVFDEKDQEQINNRMVYLIDGEGIRPITQEEIVEKLDSGMTVFSKTKRVEYTNILENRKSENEKETTKKRSIFDDIKQIASDEEVMKQMEEVTNRHKTYEKNIKESEFVRGE